MGGYFDLVTLSFWEKKPAAAKSDDTGILSGMTSEDVKYWKEIN